MDLIHADSARVEIGFVSDFDKFDCIVSQEPKARMEDNSFSLSLSDGIWAASPIRIGHYIYVPNTELGGMVERIKHNTDSRQITVSGLTWRGMLYRKIICPTAGSNYMSIRGMESNMAISAIIGGCLGDSCVVSTVNSGIVISNKDFRYINMLAGIQGMLAQYGAALDITYDQTRRVAVFASRAVVDYSDIIDLSQDYGAKMVTTTGSSDAYNHIIALGAGELENRDILHVYRLDNGKITLARPDWHGTARDLARVYDYNNPEDIEKLREGAEKLLIEAAPLNTVEIDPQVEGLTLQMGDIVGARDRLTGTTSKVTVLGKILTMDARGIRTETKVG